MNIHYPPWECRIRKRVEQKRRVMRTRLGIRVAPLILQQEVTSGSSLPKRSSGLYVSRRFYSIQLSIEVRNFRCLVPLPTLGPIPTFRDANSAAVSPLTLQYLPFMPFCGASENLSPDRIQSSQWFLFVTKTKHVLSIFE